MADAAGKVGRGAREVESAARTADVGFGFDIVREIAGDAWVDIGQTGLGIVDETTDQLKHDVDEHPSSIYAYSTISSSSSNLPIELT